MVVPNPAYFGKCGILFFNDISRGTSQRTTQKLAIEREALPTVRSVSRVCVYIYIHIYMHSQCHDKNAQSTCYKIC